VRNEGPRDPVDAGITFEVAGSQFRQFAIKAAWEVVANFAQLFLNYKKVIDQPFRRGCDGLFPLDCPSGGAVVFEQNSAKTRPFSMTCGRRGRPCTISRVMVWAAARLSACCSRRSALNNSARIGPGKSGNTSVDGLAVVIVSSTVSHGGRIVACGT
jgi:hypothetical protein